MAGIRLTDKMNLLADARFSLLMERRKHAGKDIVNPTTALAVMWALINRSDQDGRCDPSQRRIAIESNTSDRTVRRVVELFEDEGVIAVRSRHHTAGVSRSDMTDEYQIDWETFAELRDGGRLVTTGQPDHRSLHEPPDRLTTGQPPTTGQRCTDHRPAVQRPPAMADGPPIEIARRSSDPSDENQYENHPSAEVRENHAERLSAPGEKLAGGWATPEEVAAWKSRLAQLDYPVMNPLTIFEEFRLAHTEAMTVYREFDRKRIQAAACAVRKYLREGQAIENPTGLLLRILRRHSRPAERTQAGQLAGRILAIRRPKPPVSSNPFETIAKEVASR